MIKLGLDRPALSSSKVMSGPA